MQLQKDLKWRIQIWKFLHRIATGIWTEFKSGMILDQIKLKKMRIFLRTVDWSFFLSNHKVYRYVHATTATLVKKRSFGWVRSKWTVERDNGRSFRPDVGHFLQTYRAIQGQPSATLNIIGRFYFTKGHLGSGKRIVISWKIRTNFNVGDSWLFNRINEKIFSKCSKSDSNNDKHRMSNQRGRYCSDAKRRSSTWCRPRSRCKFFLVKYSTVASFSSHFCLLFWVGPKRTIQRDTNWRGIAIERPESGWSRGK